MRNLLPISLLVLAVAGGCNHAASNNNGDGGNNGEHDGGTNDALAIAPQNVTLEYIGMPAVTQQFTASKGKTSVNPTWSVDPTTLGTIDATGKFTSNGTPGKGLIYAKLASETAFTSITVKVTDVQNGDPAYPAPPPGPGGYGGVGGDGPGAPASDAQKATLDGAATVDATVKVLYPYDGTVWPRGLLAPLIQWDSGAHNFDAIKIELGEINYSYKGYFARPMTTSTFRNVPIPLLPWQNLTDANFGEDVTVKITLAEGTTAYGPYTMTWKVAPATLKGTVYYNSYGTALVRNSGEKSCGKNDNNCGNPSNRHGPAFGGATLAIKVGTLDPVLVAGTQSDNNSGCRVCHTVSANGSRLLTQHGNNYSKSSLYALTMANAETNLPQDDNAFPAVYPDGSIYLSSSGGMINGDSTSRLYSLPAGTLVTPAPTGLPDNLQAAVPAFSPDGTKVAFNFYSGPTGADGKSLGLMGFDLAGKTFTAPTVGWTPMAPNDGVVVWPSFMPTSSAVLFELETATNEWGYTRYGNRGELWYYDVASKQAVRLDKLNGKGYLPTLDATGHTSEVEPTLNYEPTVNPIASGGYAWVVFTSRRLYGNVATIDPWHSDPREYRWESEITTKKLWVAAIDLNAPAGTDPSHPAFYLPAQELFAGNMRGFWSLDPCQPDGNSCQSGDECCGGYCEQIDPQVSQCTSTPPVCAKEFEKCNADTDCCDAAAGITCINHICTYGSPPIP